MPENILTDRYKKKIIAPGIKSLIFTELFIIGTIFVMYLINYGKYESEFRISAGLLNAQLGAIITLILIGIAALSYFSVTALKNGNRFLSVMFLGLIVIISLFYYVIDFVQSLAIKQNNIIFSYDIFVRTKTEGLFYNFYFAATFMINFFIFFATALSVYIITLILKQKITPANSARLEDLSLFWQSTIFMWLLFYPFIYLIK